MSVVSFSAFAKDSEVVAGFSTRTSGNVGLHVGDDPTVVLKNRQLFARELGVNANHIVTAQQVHGTNIQIVTEDHRGKGASDWSQAFSETDGLVTDVANIPLLVVVADCAAIYVYDPVHRAIGLGHAGWRGTLNGLTFALLNAMHEQYGSLTKDLKVAVSPCIGVECYEVGEEVVAAFHDTWGSVADTFFDFTSGKPHFDLKKTLQWQLSQLGVLPQNLEISPDCTSCHTDRFFSHRAEKGQTGRMGAVLMLKPE